MSKGEKEAKVKKPIFKKWWFWVIVGLFIIIVIAAASGDTDEENAQSSSQPSAAVDANGKVIVITGDEAGEYGKELTYNAGTEFEETIWAYYIPEGAYTVTNKGEYRNQLNVCNDETHTNEEGWEETADANVYMLDPGQTESVEIKSGYHVEVSKGSNFEFTAQSADVQPAPTEKAEESVPTEYKSALKKAIQYGEIMHMSKAGIYNQLTSEYGEKFTPEAAQYAIDNADIDYKANALEKAKDYQNTMNMSPAAIYDQLISEYGEQFTAEEAQYAIDNLG